MNDREKVVVRFNDGRLIKGYLADFSVSASELKMEENETGKLSIINIQDVKAIFFVRTFEGDRGHKEIKSYSTIRPKRHRAFIKFKDGEGLVGFLEGDVPWQKGFFLSGHYKNNQGFFVLPVDEQSNNIKVFVIVSSVADVTVVP